MKLETPPAPPAPAPRGAVGIDIPHPTMENTEERAEGRSWWAVRARVRTERALDLRELASGADLRFRELRSRGVDAAGSFGYDVRVVVVAVSKSDRAGRVASVDGA